MKKHVVTAMLLLCAAAIGMCGIKTLNEGKRQWEKCSNECGDRALVVDCVPERVVCRVDLRVKRF